MPPLRSFIISGLSGKRLSSNLLRSNLKYTGSFVVQFCVFRTAWSFSINWTNEVSTYASKSSALKPVRDYLLDAQRNVAKKYNVIMDGRDIGTVILPKADVKFFMSASTESRAHRRHKELLEKGEKITYEEVLSSMLERDKNDSSRKIAPAIPAEDSIPLDNSGPIEETIEFAKKIINERIKLTK